MNRPPEILINNGFVTDQNGVLTEMVIPSNVVTQNIPSIVTTYATAINWIPSNATTLIEFNAPNITSIASAFLGGYTSLQRVSMAGLQTISNTYSGYDGAFVNCTSLSSVNLPNLKTITNNRYGAFYNTAITSITLPELETIQNSNGPYCAVFGQCNSLVNVTFPKIQNITTTVGYGVFTNLVNLKDVQFGSNGNPVTSIGSSTFSGCTQSGLTITIYTANGASLSGEPWGATNADIEYEEA